MEVYKMVELKLSIQNVVEKLDKWFRKERIHQGIKTYAKFCTYIGIVVNTNVRYGVDGFTEYLFLVTVFILLSHEFCSDSYGAVIQDDQWCITEMMTVQTIPAAKRAFNGDLSTLASKGYLIARPVFLLELAWGLPPAVTLLSPQYHSCCCWRGFHYNQCDAEAQKGIGILQQSVFLKPCAPSLKTEDVFLAERLLPGHVSDACHGH
ncbi:hypothetical protein AAES_120981 [Amazona aestiva]|uniref:Uncharacterized protein n=1 Tax=Amazona aestiva TaxID=12930 RepID=A0A0Q3TBX2_AMAAE|nr:hypothetical protein AAES_120981 [Amazona aestiva]